MPCRRSVFNVIDSIMKNLVVSACRSGDCPAVDNHQSDFPNVWFRKECCFTCHPDKEGVKSKGRSCSVKNPASSATIHGSANKSWVRSTVPLFELSSERNAYPAGACKTAP
jgi:hypothetical protein